MTKIFISYRRAASSGQALLLHERLAKTFGKRNVFIDVHGIPAGQTFETYILKKIQESDVFLALVAQGTLERIHNDDDWVRKEIAFALEQQPHLRVIPVLVDSFPMPNPSDLPTDVRTITGLNARYLIHHLFDASVKDLVTHIKSMPMEAPPREWAKEAARVILAMIAVTIIFLAGFAFLNLGGDNPQASQDETQDSRGIIDNAQTEEINPSPSSTGGQLPAPTETDTSVPTHTASITNTITATETPTNTKTPTSTLTDIPSTETDTPTPTEIAINSAPTIPDDILALAIAGVEKNEDWIPFEADFDGVTMVLVPTGCFMMGNEAGDENEQPVNEQCFEKPFWIDKYEVTNEQFGSTACEYYSFEPNQARICVNWSEARNSCGLRSTRLPTEAEWEYAARGVDNLIYPWGDEWVENIANSYTCTLNCPKYEVGSKTNGQSWVGALDMSGNVWEWVSSQYKNYPYSSSAEPPILGGFQVSTYVVRGGSINDGAFKLRSTYRSSFYPEFSNNLVGFRCARDFE